MYWYSRGSFCSVFYGFLWAQCAKMMENSVFGSQRIPPPHAPHTTSHSIPIFYAAPLFSCPSLAPSFPHSNSAPLCPPLPTATAQLFSHISATKLTSIMTAVPSLVRLDSDPDDRLFHDARETLTSSGMSYSSLPPHIPSAYSRIEPLPSSIPPLDNELSLFKLVKEIFSSVKPGADVTHIKLPASILDPYSTLEKAKKSMQRGELIQDMCASPDPTSRILNVLRFNLSGLAKERFGKKPYNPVLGEVYRCCFPHKGAGGETLLVAEQVSHHPPITALHLRNDTLGFRMNSFTAPEPRFWGNSLEVKLRGEIRIVLTTFDDEEYIITRPVLHMTGFIAGRQRLEFIGKSSITCRENGLAVDLEFKNKNGIRGDIHGINGRIYRTDDGQTLYSLDGHWDKKVTLTDAATGRQSTLYDYEAVLMEKSMVAVLPVENELEETFSTLVWAECSKAIRNGDTLAANDEKRKVEEKQRVLKRERESAGVEWKWHYFEKRKDGAEGWTLREDLGPEGLVKLHLEADELDGLRTGETIKEMQAEMQAGMTTSNENSKRGARKFFGRRGK